MNFDLVFLFIVCLFIAYTLFDNQINESMADTSASASTSTTDAIRDAVKQVYLADVQAIRNLSNVATKLQTNGVTIPGKIIIGQSADNVSNSISDRNFDPEALCIVGQGVYPKRKIHLWDDVTIDNNLSITNGSLTTSGLLTAGNVLLNTGIQGPNGKLRISNQGIMFGGSNTDREVNSCQISAGLHIPDSLNIIGMSNKDKGSRRIDMWAEGGLNVYGNTTVGGDMNVGGNMKLGSTTLTEDLLKRIINQQSYAGFAIDGNSVGIPLYEGQYNLNDTKYFNSSNDTWDIVYINRGWRITVAQHYDLNGGVIVGENKSSNVPQRLNMGTVRINQASSYKAEWIGY